MLVPSLAAESLLLEGCRRECNTGLFIPGSEHLQRGFSGLCQCLFGILLLISRSTPDWTPRVNNENITTHLLFLEYHSSAEQHHGSSDQGKAAIDKVIEFGRTVRQYAGSN